MNVAPAEASVKVVIAACENTVTRIPSKVAEAAGKLTVSVATFVPVNPM